ncbi:hypothetical protein ETP77_16150 [Acinetobacter baumannii]|nr:hypothetical protein ETP77_16150 [Acinetobacter baumannii]
MSFVLLLFLKNLFFSINNTQYNVKFRVRAFYLYTALLHKDLKCKAPLIEPNLRRNLGKWST